MTWSRARRTLNRLAWLAWLAPLACMTITGAHGADTPGASTAMNDAQVDAVKLLSLPDEGHFTLDVAGLRTLQLSVAAALNPTPPRAGPPGSRRAALRETLAIAAPSRIDLPQHGRAPLLIASVRSGQREWEVQQKQNFHVLLSNLSTGSVELSSAVEQGRRMKAREPSKSGPPPDALNAAGGATRVWQDELTKRFSRESLNGRLALTVIEFDRVSNTVTTEARGAAGEAPAGRRVTRSTAQPAPTGTAPPAGGVSFALPTRLDAQTALLTGTLRLPRERLTAVVTTKGTLVAATLVLVRLDDPAPLLLHLTIPAQPQGGSDLIDASFSVDLRGATAGRALNGDCLAYLVVGDTVSTPQPVKVALP